MSDRPLVTVFILNWNRREDLLPAVESVENQSYRPIEILVVDSASTDGSVEAVKQNYPEVRVVRLDKNYGCPGGRNRGIPHAKGEFIFFADNDGLLHREAVERAYTDMCRDDRISVVTGRVESFDSLEEADTSCDVGPADGECFPPTFLGGVSLHRKSMYEEVGVYPDNFMYGGEETNMAYRMLDRGHLIFYDPTVILWHRSSAVARSRRNEFLYKLSNVRSTAWELWPIELAIIHTLRALTLEPIRALVVEKCFWAWFRRLPLAWARAVRSALWHRCPVRRKTMQIVWRLRKRSVKSPEEVFRIDDPYWRSLLRMLLKARVGV